MNHTYRLLPIFAVFFSPILQAQSMDEFEQFKKQVLGEYSQYREQIDKEFSDFLKQQWEPFDTEKGQVRDEKPKPAKIPVAKVKPKPIPPKPKAKPETKPKTVTPPPPPVRLPPKIKTPVVKPQPVIIPPPPPTSPDQRLVEVEYLGHKLGITDGMRASYPKMETRVSQSAIQKNFSALAQTDFRKTVDDLKRYQRQLDLNDWAYLQLTMKFADKLPLNTNNKRLVTWFLLLKSDLKARVAYDNSRIFLLVASRQSLYDVAYFKFDGEKFYTVPQTKKLPGRLFSYDGRYPKALSNPDFSITRNLRAKDEPQYRDLKFKFKGKAYTFKVPVNKHKVGFYATYPQMDIAEYFRTSLDDRTANSLLTQLRPVVVNMSETDAVNFLLAFVQHAFKYQTDGQQFGEENYMFIEETLYYPSSDCEDRSIIFAWLVRNLLQMDVVGLEFPGHVATAVHLRQPVGEIVSYNNKRFSIADPTYINARVGMKMPQYSKTKPKVIR
jgi:hypothetical protein